MYDAFCGEFASGNPCGVVLLNDWLCDSELLDITREIAQPVTSFVVVDGNAYRIRWFSPTGEINLCGHGSLGAGAEILNCYRLNEVLFQSDHGNVTISRQNGLFSIRLPSWRAKPYRSEISLNDVFGPSSLDVFTTRDMVVVLDSEAAVINFEPDFARLKLIERYHALIVTAQSSESEYVLRYFAPKIGIPEDLATGSAHCSLAPYWFHQLGRNALSARQLSSGGGQFKVEKESEDSIVICVCQKTLAHRVRMLWSLSV
ncbi:PhzF family phenazine biosynthesis protein [Vibrio sp. PP-XX7]